MIAASPIDDELEPPDRVLAELDAMREQLSAIEAALPDYGPSFSAIEQQAKQIKTAIEKVAASPPVSLSAAEHASKSARAISELLAPSLAKLQKAIEGTDERQSELISLTNALHVRSMHRSFPWMWLAVALVAGFWLYPLIAATVPGGSNLAVLATSHSDRWSAGSDLMNAANPGAWAAINRTSQILAENEDAFVRCVAAADRVKARQACTIQVGPSVGQR